MSAMTPGPGWMVCARCRLIRDVLLQVSVKGLQQRWCVKCVKEYGERHE